MDNGDDRTRNEATGQLQLQPQRQRQLRNIDSELQLESESGIKDTGRIDEMRKPK